MTMRKIKHFFISAAVISLSVILPASAQNCWTLDDCLDYARENNIDIQRRLVEIEMQKANLNISNSAWLPSVGAALDGDVDFGKSAKLLGMSDLTDSRKNTFQATGSINASMPVFGGFRIKNQVESDRFLLEAATADLEKAKKDLGIQVATYYLQCLYYKSLVDVLRNQLEVSGNLVERSRVLVQEGRKPEADLAYAKAQFAEDEYNLKEAEGNSVIALMELAQLMNLESPGDFDVVDIEGERDIPLTSPSEIYEESIASFPSIVSAENMIKSMERNVEVAKADYYPQLSLVAGVATGYNQIFENEFPSVYPISLKDNLYEYAGLKLTFSIFNRNITKNRINRAKLQIDDRKLFLADARLNLRKEIQTAYTNAVVAQGERQSALKAVEATELSIMYEQERYESGRGNIFDLQSAMQKCLNAKMKAVQSKYEYLIRLRILDFYK